MTASPSALSKCERSAAAVLPTTVAPVAVVVYSRTQKVAPFGIEIVSASDVLCPPFEIVPDAEPENLSCVHVPAGYSIDAVTIAEFPGWAVAPLSGRADEAM